METEKWLRNYKLDSNTLANWQYYSCVTGKYLERTLRKPWYISGGIFRMDLEGAFQTLNLPSSTSGIIECLIWEDWMMSLLHWLGWPLVFVEAVSRPHKASQQHISHCCIAHCHYRSCLYTRYANYVGPSYAMHGRRTLCLTRRRMCMKWFTEAPTPKRVLFKIPE